MSNRATFAERGRAAEILNLGARHGLMDVAEDSIRRGDTVREFRAQLVKRLALREHGGTFSFGRMLEGMRGGKLTGIEAETLQETAKLARLTFDPQRVVIPWGLFARDLVAGTGAAGGYLVGTGVGEALDILRPWSVAARAGITIYENLRESITLPRTGTKVATNWFTTEATAASESTPALGSIGLSPKIGGGYLEISRQFSLQAAGEAYVRNELMRSVGSMVDATTFNGSGASGQPTGILNTAGIGSQSGTSLAWAGIVNMKETVATANGDDASLAYIGTSAVRELLELREKFTGAGPIWNGDDVGGRPGFVTTDLPASTLICGDFSEVILGLWGAGIQIEVNPYANFPAGIIGARLLVGCDVAVKHAAALCVASSVS